jgi:hypothetical protein
LSVRLSSPFECSYDKARTLLCCCVIVRADIFQKHLRCEGKHVEPRSHIYKRKYRNCIDLACKQQSAALRHCQTTKTKTEQQLMMIIRSLLLLATGATAFSTIDYAARAREWVLADGFHAPAKTELMADDFVWFGPLVGPLNKEDFLGTVSLFKVYNGFPDLKIHLSAFTRDPVEENRYWSILRLEGTHTQPQESGTGAPPIKPTGNKLDVGPQAVSVTFDADGRVSRYTGGYVVDRRQGSCGEYGGYFAITKTVGGFIPGRRLAKSLNAVGALLKNFPKNRSRREDLPAKWRSLGRGFGKRTKESWD